LFVVRHVGTARLDTLVELVSTRSTRRTCRVVSRRDVTSLVKFGLKRWYISFYTILCLFDVRVRASPVYSQMLLLFSVFVFFYCLLPLAYFFIYYNATAHPTVRSQRLRETFFSMCRAVCLELTSCVCHRKRLTVCFQI